MPFGLPCPETLQPDQALLSLGQIDSAMSGVIEAIMSQLSQDMATIEAYINQSLDVLESWLQKRLDAVNRVIGDVFSFLLQTLHASQFSLSTEMEAIVTNIASELQISTDEVRYGPVSAPTPTAPFPPYQPPAQPGQQPPTYPPGYAPVGPQTPPAAPSFIPPPNPIVPVNLGGQVVMAQQLCQPVQSQGPVSIGGGTYLPTFTIVNNGSQLPVSPAGNPQIPLGYDQQPDGSTVIHLGPISVIVSLPSTTPGQPPAVCNPIG